MIFYQQNFFEPFAVERKEEKKRVESIRQFCEECCLWYSRECKDLMKRSGCVRSRINGCLKNCFVISIGGSA